MCKPLDKIATIKSFTMKATENYWAEGWAVGETEAKLRATFLAKVSLEVKALRMPQQASRMAVRTTLTGLAKTAT